MISRTPRLPALLRRELEGTDWHWESGTKHWKLIVNGKMCGIFPRGYRSRVDESRDMYNTRAQVRRAKLT